MIDKLMTVPKYARSRTALILRALDFGLPLVMNEEFCMPVAESETKEYIPVEPEDAVDLDALKEIVYLLHDIDVNTTITKSLTCSLFNEKSKSLYGTNVDGDRFTKGGLRATPDYMEGYELAQLKMIKESSKR
jgi:hypothetical protein